MKYLRLFENFQNNGSILIIVDVQRSFCKYFNDEYLNQLKRYCEDFKEVYQLWDNHVNGKKVDKDYLYDDDHESDSDDDLYKFPNQKDTIEKRYNYDVDADFYKNILDPQIYNKVKSKEKDKTLQKGEFFPTKEGTIIVYIGNNHNWYHVPKKLFDLFNEISQAQANERLENVGEVVLVGGAEGECLEDIEITAKSLGVKATRNSKFIYSATECPIK